MTNRSPRQEFMDAARRLVDQIEADGCVYSANDGGGFIGTDGVKRIAIALQDAADGEQAPPKNDG